MRRSPGRGTPDAPGRRQQCELCGTCPKEAGLVDGQAYLSRGVLGDLLGLLVLAAAGTRLRARLLHEALLCLLLIGLVLAVGPR